MHHDQCGLKEYFCFVYNISCLQRCCKHFPELLLYWLFYINKHSQNVADKKPVIRLLSDSSVLAAFSFYERVNMGCSYFFVAESIQQEVNETAFRDFQHIRCLHLEHTCTNAADVVRCRRTRVVRASKQRYVKIEEGGLFHFRTFIQLCNSNFYFRIF